MNPFPGLRPFETTDSCYYFGRKRFASRMLVHLRVSPLTVMYARSGLGKSSFLQCRLVPELSANSHVRVFREWGHSDPWSRVRNYIQELKELGSDQGFSDSGLYQPPVLILDQFEDVFKIYDTRRKLWELLAKNLNIESVPVHVLICMREEWLGAWEESEDFLPEATNAMIRFEPFTLAELREAIQRPIEIEATKSLDPKLIDALIVALRIPNPFGYRNYNVEPALLQLVMQTLWNESSETLSVEIFEQLGRVDGITRDYVWRTLGRLDRTELGFDKIDRVIWCGITPLLSSFNSGKVVVSARSLAGGLRIEDMGIPGTSVLLSAFGMQGRNFFRKAPDQRDSVPSIISERFEMILEKAVNAGFLKEIGIGRVSGDTTERLYELAHDLFSEVLHEFRRNFLMWFTTRWVFVWLLLWAFGSSGYLALVFGEVSYLATVVVTGIVMVLILVIYAILGPIFAWIFGIIVDIPIFLLLRGRMPKRDPMSRLYALTFDRLRRI